MFPNLRLKKQPVKVVPDSSEISTEQLERDPAIPITLRQINNLPVNAKKRILRLLLPMDVLVRFGIDPITWKDKQGNELVGLSAEPGTSRIRVGVRQCLDAQDDFFEVQLSDNSLNGIDLDFLGLHDPCADRFNIDFDEQGNPTYYGTARRNIVEEGRALRAGLSPAQVRTGLRVSR